MCEDGFDYPHGGDPLKTSRKSYWIFQGLFFLPAVIALVAALLVRGGYVGLE
ncbi:MAG: hypothetical protein MAG715_01295 [Methanonatronarchaeales archaeon]|nr:hypothetical protein [Methanonatronarchaeales archaeon]